MTGTTFAMSWCISPRRCAVAGHDFRKTLIQTIKTRVRVSALCAKAVHRDQCLDPAGRNLVHKLSARTALVLF
jgi:hypothetical protein